jgi:hypothetical protein
MNATIDSSAFSDVQTWELPSSLQNEGQLSLRQQTDDGEKRYVIIDTRQQSSVAVVRTSGFDEDRTLRFDTVKEAIEAALDLVEDGSEDAEDEPEDDSPLDDSDDSEAGSSDEESNDSEDSDSEVEADDSETEVSDDSDDGPSPAGSIEALPDDVIDAIATEDAPWQNETVLRAVLDEFDQKQHMALVLGCAAPTVRKWELRLD